MPSQVALWLKKVTALMLKIPFNLYCLMARKSIALDYVTLPGHSCNFSWILVFLILLFYLFIQIYFFLSWILSFCYDIDLASWFGKKRITLKGCLFLAVLCQDLIKFGLVLLQLSSRDTTEPPVYSERSVGSLKTLTNFYSLFFPTIQMQSTDFK